MGGTDRNDQLTKLYRSRQHYKWPRRPVVNFFMWCTYNAYILQNLHSPHKQQNKRFNTFHMFIEQLRNDLVGTYNCRKGQQGRAVEVDDSCLVNQSNIPLHIVERPVHASGKNKCVVCSEVHKRAKKKTPRARMTDLPKIRKTVL